MVCCQLFQGQTLHLQFGRLFFKVFLSYYPMFLVAKVLYNCKKRIKHADKFIKESENIFVIF